MTSKWIVYPVALVILAICLYAFLLMGEVFDGKFKTDPFAWYILAKGIFCSLSLVLTREMLEAIRKIRE